MREVEKDLLFEQMKLNSRASFRVGGFCMTPVIRNGAEVTVEPAEPEKLQPGEIIAYFIGSQLLVHRLLENNALSFKMCADGPQGKEHLISAGDILGRVVRVKNPSLFRRILIKLINNERK